MQTWGLSTLAIPLRACMGATLTSAETLPVPLGTSVHVTATPGSCSAPLYEFWLNPGAGGSWQMLRGYGPTPTITLDSIALGLKPGTYSVVAWVKSASSAALYDGYSLLSVTFGGCDSATLSSDVASPQKAGQQVIFTASGSGPSCSAPQYEFWVLPTGGSWQLAQPWSSKKTLTWPTAGLAPTSYAVVVWVTQQGDSPPSGYETYDLVSFALTG
jgi:hypothetical protein